MHGEWVHPVTPSRNQSRGEAVLNLLGGNHIMAGMHHRFFALTLGRVGGPVEPCKIGKIGWKRMQHECEEHLIHLTVYLTKLL